MSEAGDKPPRRKIWKYLLFAVLILLVIAGTAIWYTTTSSFQAMVRRRLVAEVELITGGRAELGSFHAVPFRFRVEVRDLTIHGLENSSQVPYAHVGRLIATLKISTALGFELGFHSVVLDDPVIHIITYPDGTTNQPQPKLEHASERNAIQDLFALSVSRLEVRKGELILNDQKIPLDFTANDVSADMTYSVLHRTYEGNLLLGKVDTTLRNYRPLAWTAEAHFVLSSGAIEVNSLKATSGRSRISASGRVDDFRNPKIQGTYDARIDLGEAAAILRRRDITGGILQASGKGSWSLQDFSSAGKIVVSDLDGRNQQVKLTNARFSTEYNVTPKRLTLRQIQARALGGTATGDADISNWLNSTPPVKSKNAQQQVGVLRLQLHNFSLRDLSSALSNSRMPLERLSLAGAGAGTLEAHWTGSPNNAQVQLALDVAPPPRSAIGQVGLTARLRGTYYAQSGTAEVTEFSASTAATQIRASGTLASTAAVNISISTTDLREWQPVLNAFGAGSQLPVVLHGRAMFNGTARGKVSAIILAGHLQMQDFDTVVQASSRTPRQPLHWDSLVSDIQISRSEFAARNTILDHGPTVIRLDGTAALRDGQFTNLSHFNARFHLHHGDISEILTLSGLNYPITGEANLGFHVAGTWDNPQGEGHLQLENATAYGEQVEQFASDVHLLNDELSLEHIALTHEHAHVTGDAIYDRASHDFQFDLTGGDFDLARIPRLQGSRFAIGGKTDFTAKGSGSTKQPVIDATFHLRDLTLDQEHVGNFTLQAVTEGPQTHITGRSQFNQAELDVDGNVMLHDDWPATLNMHFDHVDVDALLRSYLHGRLTGHSAVVGDVLLNGPLLQPRQLDLAANLRDFSAELEKVKIRNDGPLRFAITHEALSIQQFRLVGEGTDLTATGSVQFTGEEQLDLRAQGSVNVQLIETLDPDFTSSGLVNVDVIIGGTLSKPITQGQVQISNANIAYLDLPSSLSDMNGTLLFNQDRLQIQTLTAHTGGGLVTFQGYATAYNRQINFNLSAHGQDVRLRYPPGVSSTATADVHWIGTPQASALTGDVTVKKLAITPGFDFGAYLTQANQSTVLPQANPLLNRIKLDVHIVTTPELQMQTATLRLSGDADLHLRGSAAKPVLLGRADVLEGEIYFNGTKYRLERGDVTFTNPVTTTPVVDLQATTQVRDYDITVALNGPPDKLHVTYRSEPPLPETDIVALLALGVTQEESAQLQQSGQTSLTQQTSNAILAEALNATVSNRVQRLFGGSRIKIDPQGLTTETSIVRGPQVTIEQQVANNLTVIYSTNVSQTSQQIIQMEYNITHNISVVGVRDQNGVVSFDVRIRRRKR